MIDERTDEGMNSKMINLKANPFFLDDEAIAWVNRTLSEMTVEEKVGYLSCLFFNLG